MRLPHPLALLLACVLLAALVTHLLPAGEFERREDPATGRQVVVAGTYRAVEAQPVGPFAAMVAVPRGMVAAAEVMIVVLLVGGAWMIPIHAGTLGRGVTWLAARFATRRLVAIPVIVLLFGAAGALENMQEEIIPLVPALLVLARALGYNPVVAAAVSVGAAMVGSAFSPVNPFQASIALKLAELPPLEGALLRTTLLVLGLTFWIAWTMRHARRTAVAPEAAASGPQDGGFSGRDGVVLLLMVAPLALYVVGALQWGWGFNELSGAFLAGGILAGMVARLGVDGTVKAYYEGIAQVAGAAVLVGVARAISVVLEDGRVIDTILLGMAAPLEGAPRAVAPLLMVPLQALLHIPVSSVSGQAVLTMPVLVPLADLLGFSRQAVVMAYQTGAGLTEIWTPTNGALMAVLLAAGVPFGAWLRFAVPAVLVLTALGIAGVIVATGM